MTYGGGHVNVLLPVLDVLRRQGHDLHVLGLTTAFARLKGAGFAPLGFRDFLRPTDRRAIAHGRRIAEQMHTDGKADKAESIAYLGLSYADLEDRLGAGQARQEFSERGRHAFLPLGPMRRVMDWADPDVVLVTSCPRAETAATLVARERGIASVGVEDLFAQSWFGAQAADVVCAPFKEVLPELQRRGMESDRVRITGNPSFDRILDLLTRSEMGRLWRRQHAIAADETLVLYAMQQTNGPHIRTETIAECLAECAARDKRFRVAVRPHPSQPHEVARRLVKRLRGQGIVAVEPSLDPLLLACDVVATSTSTVSVEAALVGRRVVMFGQDPNDPRHRVPLHRFGWAEFATTPISGVEPLMQPPDEQATLQHRGEQIRAEWNCDGHAARRIAEVVVEAASRAAAA
ncbi:MAG: hypothetical protein IIA67_10140 [Planctomycetes bacterium]|nr:hypothetical protein [Planctomycetota bacterium]